MFGAAFALIGVVRTTIKEPKDWRLALVWVGWLATLGLAIGTVIKVDEDRKLDS
jgi:uncharacterized membrane protein